MMGGAKRGSPHLQPQVSGWRIAQASVRLVRLTANALVSHDRISRTHLESAMVGDSAGSSGEQ
jgi:hypothetical protein